jgi:NDP-sugar pyrophosphorylase family protein
MSTIREILVAQAFEPHHYPHENLRATNSQNVLDGLARLGQVRNYVTKEEWFEHVRRKELSKTKRKAIEQFAEESKPFGWDIWIGPRSVECEFRCNCCNRRKKQDITIHYKRGRAYAKLPIYCVSCIHDNQAFKF